YEEITASVPLEKKVPVPMGNAYKKLKTGIFNKELVFPPNKKQLEIKSYEKTLSLPFYPQIYCKIETLIPIKYETVTLTMEEARTEAKLLTDKKIAALKDCQVIFDESEEVLCNNRLIIKRLLTVKKDIAKFREF
ncbi:MAG: sporulation protein YqfD, partial [Oscillospiraceae bacterium]